MKTFDSRHYQLLGYKSCLDIDDLNVSGWLLMSIQPQSSAGKTEFQMMLISEAKFVKEGEVFFLKDNGTVENRRHERVLLPA